MDEISLGSDRPRWTVAVGLAACVALAVVLLSLARHPTVARIAAAPQAAGTQSTGPQSTGLQSTGPTTPKPTPESTPESIVDIDPVVPPDAVAIGAVGLGAVGGTLLVTASGTRVPLDLPAGYQASSAVAVPGGWVVMAANDTGAWVWFQSDDGKLSRLTPSWGGYEVAPDGRTLVVAGADNPTSVVAFHLPDLTRIRATTFAVGMGPMVTGIGGDWAILRAASGDGGPTAAAAWNLRTGQLRPTDQPVNIWGVTRDGRALQWVPIGDGPPDTACLDLVSVAELVTVRPTGLCSAVMARPGLGGQVSPDGQWVVLTTPETSYLARTADLRAGRWRPRSTGLPDGSRLVFWDHDATFVADGPHREILHCDLSAVCRQMALPAGLRRAGPAPATLVPDLDR